MWRDLVIYVLVVEEVKLPIGVEEEITKILVHVGSQDPSIKAIYDTPPIHHLEMITQT